MSVITRRRFVAGALAATTTPAFARSARAQTAVKIGTAVLGDYSMAGPVIVALEQGFFKSEGLAAEFVPFRGGPDLLKAVMAGECLVGITGGTDILVFREAGSPIKMIATHTEGNHFTLNVAPGERWDVVVEPDEPGVWAFHCHILPHAEGRDGMFGMVTALVVQL